ncbi:chymotrypsin-2-like [Phlebotomus papatasi]|uniref:chymotrypsin-2-like n=1 Tax=Phlebotomus papatasi TaxID=29031 RepID=UPI0024835C9B|nr:chymotrypsin-2-like [Phlebotomus papatasi]
MKSIVILSLVLAIKAEQISEDLAKGIENRGTMTRVVPGSMAKPGQFPYMVALVLDYYRIVCSGAIVGKKWVLTAAHCVPRLPRLPRPPSNYAHQRAFILAGTNDVKNATIRHLIEKFITHGRYIPGFPFHYDMALAKLKEPLHYNQYVRKIRISPRIIGEGTNATLAGFGRYDNQGNKGKLHWTDVRVMSNEECRKTNAFHDDDLEMCAVNNTVGGCNGDAGSPLVRKKLIVGVLYYGAGLCGSGIPDGYVRVSYHYAWIQRIMKTF